MGKDKRRVVLVGCGMVGMSYAYAMLNQQTCDELVLIDYVKEKAEGEGESDYSLDDLSLNGALPDDPLPPHLLPPRFKLRLDEAKKLPSGRKELL